MFGQSGWVNPQEASSKSAQIEAAANEKITNSRIANELGLSKQSISREFNLNQAQKSFENSRWQGDVLEQSRAESKERAAQASQRGQQLHQAKQSAQNRVSAQNNNQQPLSRNSPQQQSANTQKLSQPIKTTAPSLQTTQISTPKQVSAQLNSAPVVKLSTQTQNNVVSRAESSAHGTQTASKDKLSMSAFFSNTSYNASQDQSRQWQQYRQRQQDELDGIPASGGRMPAIVEEFGVQNYNEVALKQDILPRIQDVILRLNDAQRTWARVVIPLDSHSKLTLRFSTAAGRVKVSITTPNHTLSRMIANGWDILVQQSASAGITLDQPTFERQNYVN